MAEKAQLRYGEVSACVAACSALRRHSGAVVAGSSSSSRSTVEGHRTTAVPDLPASAVLLPLSRYLLADQNR